MGPLRHVRNYMHERDYTPEIRALQRALPVIGPWHIIWEWMHVNTHNHEPLHEVVDGHFEATVINMRRIWRFYREVLYELEAFTRSQRTRTRSVRWDSHMDF